MKQMMILCFWEVETICTDENLIHHSDKGSVGNETGSSKVEDRAIKFIPCVAQGGRVFLTRGKSPFETGETKGTQGKG